MSSAKDDIFSFLGRQFAKNFVESSDDKNKAASFRLTLAILGILAFVGNDAVKVMFRKNFGMNLLAWVRLFLCFLCFGGISAISFVLVDSSDEFATKSATPDAHFASGIVFAILAVTILIKGFIDASRNGDEEYSGDSNILGFLMKDGWRRKTVQNLAEPLVVLVMGLSFLPFNYIAGGAFIFCALSVWAHALFDLLFSSSSMEEDIDDLNGSFKRKTRFNKANTH